MFNIVGELGVELTVFVLRSIYLTHFSLLVCSCLLKVLRYNYIVEILSKDKEFITCLWVLIHSVPGPWVLPCNFNIIATDSEKGLWIRVRI